MNATISPLPPSRTARAPRRSPSGLRALTAATVALLALALAACGSDSSADPTDVVETAAPGEALPPTGVAAVKIDPTEGQSMMSSLGSELTVIDVRTPQEFAAGHVENAINIDVEGGDFSAGIASLDTASTYIVYCQSGRRSAIAAEAMVAAGFTQVYDMGGIQDWVAAGLPVVTG